MSDLASPTVLKHLTQGSSQQYASAKQFFSPKMLKMASGAPAPTDDQIANDKGTVQFHLIGQSTTDPAYSSIMNQNQDNLLAIGGLIHDYMHTKFPTIDAQKLDINTWSKVLGYIPDLSIGKSNRKVFTNRIAGVSVSGTFLQLIAQAIITDGASLLTDFSKFLEQMGNVTFSAESKSQKYKAITCTYQSYLVDNGAGGYFDYGAIVLREIDFTQNFSELRSSCSSANYINISMEYNEIVNLVQTRRIRKGGADYDNFQELVNANSTEQFKKAKNFFNGGSTPQEEITPKV
ncbi:hypothetical protein [Rhizobium straminoryzae]|uniref:Virulence factor Evf domain-containing protein n=1 Tax=Rhizobium straminoryzae TaxID=1387186 RepID=A0A549T090_9HYPH|nr:hypothetical protein [Rhizobium straminoryzae]TRL35297.1 hypothetical protein FNA46_20480 [Rhizobium straminoryzae]